MKYWSMSGFSLLKNQQLIILHYSLVCMHTGMHLIHDSHSSCVATDVTNISKTLRVDSVDLQDGREVEVTVSFEVHTHTHTLTLIQRYAVGCCLATKFL